MMPKRFYFTIWNQNPKTTRTLFLLGSVAVVRPRKITTPRFPTIAASWSMSPDVERVRLELARAFFLKGDYDNADRQFRVLPAPAM